MPLIGISMKQKLFFFGNFNGIVIKSVEVMVTHHREIQTIGGETSRLNHQWLGTPLPDPKFRTAWCGCPMEGFTTYGLYSHNAVTISSNGNVECCASEIANQFLLR